jgi:hypothetical protein
MPQQADTRRRCGEGLLQQSMLQRSVVLGGLRRRRLELRKVEQQIRQGGLFEIYLYNSYLSGRKERRGSG